MGFSVNTMYCFCMDQYKLSLFEISDPCEKEEPTGDVTTCCKTDTNCFESTKEHTDCTKHETKYVKADLKFIEIQKIEFPKMPVLDLAVAASNNYYHRNHFIFLSYIQPLLADRAPPQYYGRKLLNFIQVYRC